jgi:hypothetical protein
MLLAQKVLAPGPGKGTKAAIQAASGPTRFERFMVFQASGSSEDFF